MAVPKKTLHTGFEKQFLEASEKADHLLEEVPKDFVKAYGVITAAKLLNKAIKLTKEK